MKGRPSKPEMSAFTKCPDGHKLPHHINNQQCTPIFCAAETGGMDAPLRVRKSKPDKQIAAERKARRAAERETPADVLALMPGDDLAAEAAQDMAHVQKTDQLMRIGHGAGRLAARLQVLGVPSNLEGAEAEDWSDKRSVNLLPLAVAEVEYQLRFGDDKQRKEAADKVLDMNGRGKREHQGHGNAPIIILQGGTIMNPPWRQEPKATATIDVTPTPKPDSSP